MEIISGHNAGQFQCKKKVHSSLHRDHGSRFTRVRVRMRVESLDTSVPAPGVGVTLPPLGFVVPLNQPAAGFLLGSSSGSGASSASLVSVHSADLLVRLRLAEGFTGVISFVVTSELNAIVGAFSCTIGPPGCLRIGGDGVFLEAVIPSTFPTLLVSFATVTADDVPV